MLTRALPLPVDARLWRLQSLPCSVPSFPCILRSSAGNYPSDVLFLFVFYLSNIVFFTCLPPIQIPRLVFGSDTTLQPTLTAKRGRFESVISPFQDIRGSGNLVRYRDGGISKSRSSIERIVSRCDSDLDGSATAFGDSRAD